MKLSKNEYIEILNFYNIKFNTNMPLKLLRKSAEKIIATKLCRCIKKIDKKNEARSIGICTKTIINNKGFTRGKFTCKKKANITLKKKNITQTLSKSKKKQVAVAIKYFLCKRSAK